jgi:hypothetical protein
MIDPITVRAGAWLAGKIGEAGKTVLAFAAVPLLVVTVYQTIQIHGLSFPLPIVGDVNLVTGLKTLNDTAEERVNAALAQRDQANSRYDALSHETSLRTRELERKGKEAQALADKQIAEAEADLKREQAARKYTDALLRKALDNAKPGDERPLGPAVLEYLNGLRLSPIPDTK